MSSERKTHLLIAFLAFSGTLYLASDSSSSPPAGGETALRRVRVAEVSSAEARRELRFSGVTRSAERARLAFTLSGRLASRPAEVGDRVRRGQVLARLDDREMVNAAASAKATVAELEARKEQLARDAERAARLAAVKAATAEEVEQSQAALDALSAAEEAASNRLREAQRRLAETTLKAPFDGVVTDVFFERGEHAPSGRSVIALSGEGEIEVEVEVPESMIPNIASGDPVRVELPAIGGDSVPGQVVSVGRVTAGPGRLFPLTVALEAPPGVVSGMTAEVLLGVGQHAALALPVEAVVNPGGQRPAVYKVVGGKALKLAVEVGLLIGERVTVLGEGLSVGDQVVVGGQSGLLDGEAVEVLP